MHYAKGKAAFFHILAHEPHQFFIACFVLFYSGREGDACFVYITQLRIIFSCLDIAYAFILNARTAISREDLGNPRLTSLFPSAILISSRL
jgi:hypothetical protein